MPLKRVQRGSYVKGKVSKATGIEVAASLDRGNGLATAVSQDRLEVIETGGGGGFAGADG